MRIAIVDTCYPSFLATHYAAHPGLAAEPYAVQWQALMATGFGTADSYSHWLGAAGHEAHELVVNCEPLQRAWECEHGGRPRGDRLRPRAWAERILAAQIAEFDPEVVYVQNLWVLSGRLLARLRAEGRLVAGQIASEAPGPDRIRAFDLIVTSFPHFVRRFRALGVAAEYQPLAFDPRHLDALGEVAPTAEVAFAGTLARGQHGTGNALLDAVAGRLPLRVWGSGAGEWPPASALRQAWQGEAWGRDMLRVLAGARIALNRHIDVAEGHANNMRLFEATGVGALLLTDAGSNLGELFEVGREVVAYTGEDDLVEQALHYLAHEDERAAIARAGQERTLRDHAYPGRMRELAALLQQHLR